jgi:hypothetical protein
MQCLPKKVYLMTILQFLYLSCEVFSSITVLDKGVMPLEKNSVGIQFYIDVENKDRLSTCTVSTWSKDCCLTDREDCYTMQVYGGHNIIRPKDADTIVLVYPTLYQHDQIGYCDFIIEYQCGKRRRSQRLNIKVPFNTKIMQERSAITLLSHYIDGRKRSQCESVDQDSLNDCEAVNCDLKYGGERPFYDNDSGKCEEATLCESDLDKELPDVVYVPHINSCRDLEHPLSVADIYAISTGAGIVTAAPWTDDMKVELRSNCSTISQNLNFLQDIMQGNLCPGSKADTTEYSKCFKSALLSILGCIVGVCCLVLSFICCIQTLFWLHKKISMDRIGNGWQDFRSKFRNTAHDMNAGVNSEVRNALLREVIVKDIPIELRDSLVDVCQRMEKNVRKKKRYRWEEIGSQVSLSKIEYDVKSSTASSTSFSDNGDEREKLLK